MLDVFGDDYPTPDGTCIRDYIHVSDLAAAHTAAALHLMDGGASGALNLGTGHGVSVREIVEATGRVTGKRVPYQVVPRRTGDPAVLVAATAKANAILDWKARHSDIDEILTTAWNWHRQERSQRRSRH
jgi:UDP-glucose 4-epimerase